MTKSLMEIIYTAKQMQQ